MKASSLVVAALAAGVPGLCAAAPLRVAASGPAGACAPAAEAPAAERPYYQHLAKRLQVDVVRCPVPDRRAAAQALAAGQVDLAVLDPASYGAVRAQVRAAMTVRPTGGPSRVPVVIAVRAGDGAQTLAGLRGARVAFGGRLPAALAVPRTVLADKGLTAAVLGPELIAADAEQAVASLRGGQADAVALHASAYQRICRPKKPGEQRCADLAEIWRGRPQAALALAVRRDMPDTLRYRLIGIHLPMHLEARDAFAAGASWAPTPGEFEPAEAEALAGAPAS